MNKFLIVLVSALLVSFVAADGCGCGGKTVVNINLDDFEIPCCPEIPEPTPCPEIPEPTPCPDPPICSDCSVCEPDCDADCPCEDCTDPCIYTNVYTVSDIPNKGGFGFYTKNFYTKSHNCTTGEQLGTVTDGTLTVVELPNLPVTAYLEMTVYMKVPTNEYCQLTEGEKTCTIRAGLYEIEDESRKYRGGKPSQEYMPYWRIFEQYYNTITCDEEGTPFSYPIINKNDNTMAFQIGTYANLWTEDLGAGQWNYVVQGDHKVVSDFNVRLTAECPEDGPWEAPEEPVDPEPTPGR